MKKVLLVAVVLYLGMAVSAAAQTGDEAKKAIAEAKSAYTKADKVEGAWVSTSKLIKKAEKAAAKGDMEAAINSAQNAKKEAELSYAQAIDQRDNWSPPPYVR